MAIENSELNRVAIFAMRHYVSFSYYLRSSAIFAANKGLAMMNVCSGFIIAAQGAWFLITAGHVLREIEEHRGNGIDLVSFRIWDGWNLGATHRQPVSFDYFARQTIHIDEDGMDYGAIPLTDLTVENLRANGIVPIDEESYEKDWPQHFDGYALIGTPGTTVSLTHAGGRNTLMQQAVSILLLDKVENPPVELITKTERWYGRISEPENSEGWRAIGGDIRGTSGGPVLAVKSSEAGTRYWVIGVQSGWLESQRVIAASPLQVFARFLSRVLGKTGEK